MVVVAVETFEVLAVVGQEYDPVLVTPLEQFGIAGLFPGPVFRLFDIVTSLGQHSLEHPSNVFVQQNVVGIPVTGPVLSALATTREPA